MVKTKTAVETNPSAIKPQDLGYDTEIVTEMGPNVGTKATKRAIATQEITGTTRPNLMIYPGE
ncbi:MAG: hypothetical protein PWR06_394 [Thermoanaerobacteraceae bacterium]|jgi:hypothetical protein|uniref:Uncharacterized protein n=1 Tax=Biomaibacter acetigenes TaxID=2316383 RepID=A0A3G2R9F9_9FIRM|nr:hypothetical protein [Biomaibacter acetigenes]MDK2877678.1 hypothetical protein [Thermoanaerobacteraceae bacterium]RKL62805.1 hypothetical protein DXT63_09335 [Thermoanaerobacteraceae bacterium SP2]AYO32076.1 hypothetical protein D2962_17040 [Biomaibacter acetigenes]MDN5302241.1 hypothetical protein [Thermoanaerobacteraceae bacterium]MDN5312154.1 hypothetical protein [Thermoanaerobacteraceae bacterium]